MESYNDIMPWCHCMTPYGELTGYAQTHLINCVHVVLKQTGDFMRSKLLVVFDKEVIQLTIIEVLSSL